MCGISCTLTLRGHGQTRDIRGSKSPQEWYKLERASLGKQIDESLETIKHRGPDDRGYWISDNCRVGLGHVRLSIVDLSHDARQPFHDEEDSVHAVVSGEFYDYEQIREELIGKGHTFKSRCDSEIIIALYKEYGVSFISRLRGEFAFCLYDSKSQYFIAARDRHGIKPLYYTIHDGKLLIASEMKALLPYGWQPEWDVQSLIEAGSLSDSRTLFQGVTKINPGHYLAVQSFGTILQHQYWDLDYPDKREIETRSEKEMIEGVRERLLDAVRVRLRADVPVGIFLSGGLDSSATAGMIKHLMENEGTKLGSQKTDLINCFSIKFLDDAFDEEPIARRTAEWLGVKLHTVHMTEETFADSFEDATWHSEFTVADLNYIGKFALSKLTRDAGIKVVLTGEGSDEQFAGYGDLLVDFLREPDLSWPQRSLPEETRIKALKDIESPESKSNAPTLKSFIATIPQSARWPLHQINNTTILGVTDLFSLRSFTAPWTEKEFGWVDNRTPFVHNGVNSRTRELMSLKWHPLHTALYIWSHTMLKNLLLCAIGDRIEMAHSVEGRQPFLDHHLVEYVAKIPPSLKLRWDSESQSFNEKWILKEAAKPFITEELYKRRKHPLSAPITYPRNGPIHKLLERIVTKENVEKLGFLDWNRCKDLIEEGLVKGSTFHTRRLVLVAQLVTLGQRFGVKKAEPDYAILEKEVVANGFAP